MRGIVTLATALALPNGVDGAAFPYRDLIVFTAFCVVFGTLVAQGVDPATVAGKTGPSRR
jgi:CPA1 family monovalent cation:H+ antiporter